MGGLKDKKWIGNCFCLDFPLFRVSFFAIFSFLLFFLKGSLHLMNCKFFKYKDVVSKLFWELLRRKWLRDPGDSW